MKKFAAGALSLLMLLSTAGCSGGNASTDADANVSTNVPDGQSSGQSSASLSQDMQGEITVSIFNPMPGKAFLEEAAGKFQTLYPNTKINVETFAAMPEVKTAESADGGKMVSMVSDASDALKPDYVTQINTQLMSGQGADIFDIGALPYYRYAMSGQLEDLTPFMDTDDSFRLSDYRQNILEAVQIDGKQYFLPLDYNFDVVAYAPELFTEDQLNTLRSKDKMTIEEMMALAESNFDSSADARIFSLRGGAGPRSTMFGALLSEHYTEFLDIPQKKAAFNTGDFANLLTTVKDYEEKGYIPTDDIQRAAADAQQALSLMQNESGSVYFKNVSNALLMNYFTKYYSKDKSNVVRNNIAMNGVSLNDTDELLGVAANDKGEVPYTATQAYAMNANSANKDLAWAFLKFLLSEETQTSTAMSMGGVPVNISASQNKAKLQAAGVSSGMAVPGGAPRMNPSDAERPAGEDGQAPDRPVLSEGGQAPDRPVLSEDGQSSDRPVDARPNMEQGPQPNAADVTLTEDQQQIYDVYMEALEKYTLMINTFPITDDAITSVVTSEAQNFFDGSKSADEVASLIQNKVELYINE